MRKIIKNIFFTMALSFSSIVYLLSLSRSFIESAKADFLGFGQLNAILLFSFLLGLCGLLKLIKKLPSAVIRTLHFLVSAGAFYLCIILLLGLNSTPSFVLIALILYVIVYFSVVGVKAVIDAIERRAANNAKEYEAVLTETK